MIGYTTVIIGVFTAIAFYILMWKIDIKKFAGYNWQTDLCMMVIISFMFFGTLTGMVVAVVAGITMSLLLTISQYIFGALKYSIEDEDWIDYKIWATKKLREKSGMECEEGREQC